jgi:hypothetical protein
MAAKRAGKLFGIKVWAIRLALKKGDIGNYRYVFGLPSLKRDDACAIRFAEAFMNAFSLAFGPLVDMRETAALVFPVAANTLRGKEHMFIEELVQIEESRPWHERTLEFPPSELAATFLTDESYFELAWKMTPVIFKVESLGRAVQFLRASQDDFYVWPGQIDEVRNELGTLAKTGFEQSKLENALQNAFKSIEAVIGDPPKDDTRFFAKIREIGLDPDEEVGYTEKYPLHQVIRDMNKARDKKTAHGSTRQRGITIAEMLEFQACAHYIVMSAIRNKLDREISEQSG